MDSRHRKSQTTSHLCTQAPTKGPVLNKTTMCFTLATSQIFADRCWSGTGRATAASTSLQKPTWTHRNTLRHANTSQSEAEQRLAHRRHQTRTTLAHMVECWSLLTRPVVSLSLKPTPTRAADFRAFCGKRLKPRYWSLVCTSELEKLFKVRQMLPSWQSCWLCSLTLPTPLCA